MANFNLHFPKVINEIEGFFSDDPDDLGGETFRGISRLNHPSWEGWPIIDYLKGKPNFPTSAVDDPNLKRLTEIFYRRIFWERFQGDSIKSELIAGELFEVAINTGVHRAVSFLQEALNLLNRNQKEDFWDDILVDGVLGRKTLNTLGKALGKKQERRIYNVMNVLQGAFYINLMRKNPSQEKWVGWFERVSITK